VATVEAPRKYRFAPRARNSGFTQLPNEVLYEASLSAQARLLYAMLWDLATFTHEEPEQDELAEKIGCTAKTLRGYLAELTTAGLVESVRRGRGMTNAYVVYQPDNRATAKNGKNDRSRTVVDDPSRTVEITDPTRVRDSSKEDEEQHVENPSGSLMAKPLDLRGPKLVKIAGRDLAWDALERVAKAGRGESGAMSRALFGHARSNERGIRSFYAEDNPAPDPADYATEADWRREQEKWESALAMEIERRGLLYFDVMPSGTLISPLALRKWWDRVAQKADGRITDDDFAAMVERLDDPEIRRRL
jgi:predicted transcriptional regulator